jgi:hypothetical protein
MFSPPRIFTFGMAMVSRVSRSARLGPSGGGRFGDPCTATSGDTLCQIRGYAYRLHWSCVDRSGRLVAGQDQEQSRRMQNYHVGAESRRSHRNGSTPVTCSLPVLPIRAKNELSCQMYQRSADMACVPLTGPMRSDAHMMAFRRRVAFRRLYP